ncbi:hypothetical protein SLEP1_g29445 [Rubroshorea leprosula]|uniref:Transposase (putative) gypsy type domain-containing protein n=1 Tax=Rubroshorea leprosula TaxID=152421 RepID=A0AAV5JZG0_9ROSI|nr:hypothetical protein SLEP1_g29445 [Rubroshorea leprosula]
MCIVGPVICGPNWALGLIPTLLPPQRSVDELDGGLVSMVLGPKDEEGYFAFMNDLTHRRPDRLEDLVPDQMCQCMPNLIPSKREELVLRPAELGASQRFEQGCKSDRAGMSSCRNAPECSSEFSAKGHSTSIIQVKMTSSHDAQGFRGNQGEDKDVDVISVEPITMIVPPELHDSPRTAMPENSTSSSTSSGSENHQPSTSSDSPVEGTSGEVRGVEEVGCSVPSASTAVEVVLFERWESQVLSGRLDNLRKAPKTLPAGFRFRAVLHHEVADEAATVKGYKKLEQMVRRFQIPRTILIRAGTPNERACSVSRTGWVPVYVDHFEAGLRFPLPGLIFDVLAEYELALSQLTPNSIKFIIGFMLLCERLGMPTKAVVFRSLFLCRLCPSTSGTRWYYISGREKMMIFTNIRNKVARWKRQFVFVRDTRTERMNNELAARLSEWRTPNTYMNYPQLTVGDTDLKNRLLDHVKARGLVDLEALVTPDQIALLGFVDAANLYGEGEMSSILERQRLRAQASRGRGSGSQRQSRFDERPPAVPGRSSQHRSSSSAQRLRVEQRIESVPSGSRRRSREDADADTEDDVPLIRRRTSSGSQPVPAVAARPSNAPQAPAREVTEQVPASSSVAGPRIAYPDGFSYVRTECHAAMLQGMQNFVPPADRLRAKGHIQQHGGHAALIKLMDAFSYTVALFECEQGARAQNNELQKSCKQLATEKANLTDEVSRLQSSEMADRATSAESQADELARKIDELKEELVRARVERESGIQAAKEEADRAEDRAKRAEAEREKTLHDLNTMAERVSQADQHVARAEASLEECKRLHQRDLCFARTQGAEWLVGAEMFQDAVAVASANTTTDIFNEVRGKVLRVRADFPIGELAFFEGEDINEEGRSLAQPADTQVKLKWELNEEGLPVWPPSVVEEGEDTEGLPSFDAWVASPHDVPAEAFSTPLLLLQLPLRLLLLLLLALQRSLHQVGHL